MFKFLQKPLVFFRSIWIAVGVFLKSSKYPQEFQFYINKIFLKKHYKKSSRLGFFQHLKYMFKFIIVLIKTFRLLAINTDKLKYLGEKFIYKLEEKKLHAQKQAKNQDDASIKELQEIQNKNEQIHKLSYHVKNGNIEFLANAHVSRNAKISFVGSTLFRGNEADHNLPAVFDSLIKNTSNLDDIEILIAIDIDDDISYYVNIKRKYCKQIKNIRIFISPQKYGYIKLHLYDKCLYPKISPSSKMIADFSDDFQIVMKNWDRYVLQIDKKYKDNIYFIHTCDFDLERYAGSLQDSIPKIMLSYKLIAPSSYFPIFSRKILDIAYLCLNNLTKEEQEAWSPIANSFICDCYIDLISRLVQSKVSSQRVFFENIFSINPQIRRPSPDIISFDDSVQLCWGKYGLDAHDLAFLKFSEKNTVKHLEFISESIANKARS